MPIKFESKLRRQPIRMLAMNATNACNKNIEIKLKPKVEKKTKTPTWTWFNESMLSLVRCRRRYRCYCGWCRCYFFPCYFLELCDFYALYFMRRLLDKSLDCSSFRNCMNKKLSYIWSWLALHAVTDIYRRYTISTSTHMHPSIHSLLIQCCLIIIKRQ